MPEEKIPTINQLALFLGCEAVDSEYPEEGKFPLTLECLSIYEKEHDGTYPKPILRPLYDLTKEEALAIARIQRAKPTTTNSEVIFSDLNISKVHTVNEKLYTMRIEFIATEGKLSPVKEFYKISICNWGVINTYSNNSSMREEIGNNVQSLSIWNYLISKQFDVFDWIKQGLAIDKTKIK